MECIASDAAPEIALLIMKDTTIDRALACAVLIWIKSRERV
jgi:hypothetical protein